MVKSRSAKLLAVRRVTQDKEGKKTAGVDGVKSLTPQKRIEVVDELEIRNNANPLRRVWIPKTGREEKRGEERIGDSYYVSSSIAELNQTRG